MTTLPRAEQLTNLFVRGALGEQDVLDGGTVLPGFAVALAELFADLDL
jgi:hypothetical protein